jgi:SAM-dependent methyltransferase/putative flippase GtrA
MTKAKKGMDIRTKFIKFILGTGGLFLVYSGLLYALTDVAGYDYRISLLLTQAVTVTLGFLYSSLYIFKADINYQTIVKYCLVLGYGALQTFILTIIAVEIFGIWYWIAGVTAQFITALTKFGLHNNYTFGRPIIDNSPLGFNVDFEDGEYLEVHTDNNPDTYNQWFFDLFKPYFGKHLLEVGGGGGKVTIFFRKNLSKDTKFTSIEPAKDLYPLLKDKVKDLDVKVLPGVLEENLEKLRNKKIDTIMYVNVLEHIENDIHELKLCYDLLPKGGRVLIFAPAMEQLYSPRDVRVGHYRRYHYKEALRKLKLSGFNVEELSYFDRVGAILWWGKFVFLNSDKIGGGQVSFYNTVIVPISKVVDVIFPLKFGKNIIAVGKK